MPSRAIEGKLEVLKTVSVWFTAVLIEVVQGILGEEYNSEDNT